MRKRTITKWWLTGLFMAVGGTVLAAITGILLGAHASTPNFSPDPLFWAEVIVLALCGIAFCGASTVQLVAQIGALFNTHRLEDQTWFRGLLWSSVVACALLFGTLILQFILSFVAPTFIGYVSSGYGVSALISFVLMVCYLVAGPDSLADQPARSTSTSTTDIRTNTLAQA